MKAIIIIVFVFASCASEPTFFSESGINFEHEKALDITFLDVGQGDSIFIQTPNGLKILIDAGDKIDGCSKLKSLINEIERFDYIIITHYHLDHFGALLCLDDRTKQKLTNTLYDRGDEDFEYTPDGLEYLSSYGNLRQEIPDDFYLNLGTDASIQLISKNASTPNGTIVNNCDENGRSITMLLTFKNFKMFFGGDLTGGGNNTCDMESRIASVVGDITLLKVSHHGSNTSSNDLFLDTTLPEFSVISVGLNNDYNLPSNNVLSRLGSIGSDIYSTTSGDVHFRVIDGEKILVNLPVVGNGL